MGKNTLLKRVGSDVLEHVPLIIALHDTQNNIVWANRYYREAIGLPLQDIEGRKCYSVLGRDKPCRNCPTIIAIETGEPTTVELTPLNHDRAPESRGSWLSTATPIQDDDGAVIGVLEIAFDITKRKRAEKSLKESEQRLLKAQNVAGMGFLDWNLKTNEIELSERVITLYGATRSKKWTTPEFVASFVHPDDLTYVRTNLELAIKNEKKYDVYHRIVRPDKNIVWVHAQAEILRDVNGMPEKLLGTIVDVSELKRAEEEREKLQAQLIQAQKMESIGRLAGGVAHDYNNMMSVIIGYTEMAMLQMSPDHPMYPKFKQILSAANRAKDLTRQLLAFARKQSIAPKVLDLNEIVTGMFNTLQHLIGEEIDLVWLPAANVWPVKMDPSQIKVV